VDEMARRFTLNEIEVYWEDYRDAFRLLVLRDGKWSLQSIGTPPGTATRAERVRLKDHMTFPEYLKEKMNG
jgi:hypothetical protein